MLLLRERQSTKERLIGTDRGFELQPDGSVRVDDLDTGQTGYFTLDGRPIHGELRYADPQLLLWVGVKSTRQP